MMSKLASLFFLLMSLCPASHAQNSRLNDSLKLDSLSNLMYEQNDHQKFDSAIIYAKEVVSLTYLLYDSSREYAVSLNNLGYFYHHNFDYVNAEQYCKKALVVLEKYAGKNDPDYASFTNELATLYDELGNYSAAEPLYKESASIRKTISGDTSGIYAQSLNNLGNFYIKQQNYESAKINLEQSLSVRKKVKDDSYAQTLNTLALVIQKTGNYALAETKYKEALAIIDSCCGKEINEYWNIDNNLASLYYDMGNYKAAENIHTEVLSHILRKFHKKIVDYGTTLGLLARDYNTAGEYDSALVRLKEESEILLKELTNDHPDYAINLSLIASTYEKKGELDSAESYYNEVLKIRRKNFGTNNPVYAETINDLGRIYMDKKNFKNAEINFGEAAKIRLATLGKDHPVYAESIGNLLDLYYSTNNYRQWANAIDTTINTWKNSTMHLLLSFGEKEKQTYLDNHLSQRDLFLSMLWYFNKQQNTDALHASYFKMVTALQGWLLSGSQELNKIIAQKKDTSLLALFNKWLFVKNQYASAIQMNEEQRKNTHLNADSLMVMTGDLEKSIIDKLPELQESLNNTAISPAKVADTLKENEVFVNWVSFRYKNPENWTDSVLYAAFIILPKDSTAKFVTAFEQKRLKILLTNYFNYSGRGVIVKPSLTRKNIGVDLYKLIWQPLLPYIKNAGKVFVISSGLLNKISFQSMEDTMHKTLLETAEVHLLNNTNELYRVSSLLENNKTISLFGGADFDRTLSGKKIHIDANKTFNYLKGSDNEVKQLSGMFEKNNWNTKLYSGLAASEKNLAALSGNNSPEILHIATHGFYLDSNTTAYKNKLDFPLLRSGFVLSGANIYWDNDTSLANHEDDGIVTAQEISNLNFSNTRLLTLSACETALGDINNNEGVYGLQRAFKIAGVKEMLITLWQIPDTETKELMSLFYRHIFEGDSYYEALRKAQLAMKEKYPDPAVWAGFELIGE
jgi:CHAT domain-containing protein/Tfp pilus assembly protein PilF